MQSVVLVLPSPWMNIECLKLNVNSKNVQFYNMALGEKYKEGSIIVTKKSGNSGLSHIFNKNTEDLKKMKIMRKYR